MTQIDIDAQRIVTALARAQTDPSYFDSAFEILGAYVGDERQLVANRALQLGADPVMINTLLSGLGSGEVIVVTGKIPVMRSTPTWFWWLLAIGLGAGGAAFARKKGWI